MLQVDVYSPEARDHHARSPNEAIQQDLKCEWKEDLWENQKMMEHPIKKWLGVQFHEDLKVLHGQFISKMIVNTTNTWESTTPKLGFSMF